MIRSRPSQRRRETHETHATKDDALPLALCAMGPLDAVLVTVAVVVPFYPTRRIWESFGACRIIVTIGPLPTSVDSSSGGCDRRSRSLSCAITYIPFVYSKLCKWRVRSEVTRNLKQNGPQKQ